MGKFIRNLLVLAVLGFFMAACSDEGGRSVTETASAPAPAPAAPSGTPTGLKATDIPNVSELDKVQPAATQKIEVLEFFFYECSHCFHLHPMLAKWEKNIPGDVEIGYVPVMFRDSSVPLAQTFYALEAMGQQKQLDDAIYQAIHVENAELYGLDAIADFLAKKGVDRDKFVASYQSFAVGGKVGRARQMMYDYGIAGTPTLVVDGRYVITGLGPEDMIRTLDQVIARVRAARGGKG